LRGIVVNKIRAFPQIIEAELILELRTVKEERSFPLKKESLIQR